MEEQIVMPERRLNCAVQDLRVSNLEKEVCGLKTVISDQSVKIDNQTILMNKIDVVLEFIQEDRIEQKQFNKDLVDTMKSMNENLTGLNADVGNIRQKVSDLEKKQETHDERLETENASKKIDIIELFASSLKNIISSAMILGIIYILTNIVGKL
jgi:hypothetical protein